MYQRFFWLLVLVSVSQATSELPSIRPQVRGVFPRGAPRGSELTVTIRGKDLQNAREIRFVTPKLRAEILKSEHNLIEARFHLDATAEPGRHDFRLIAPHGSTIGWFDVSARPESFEKEPNDERDAAQALEFPVLLNGVVKGGDYDYFRFTAAAGQTLTFDINATRNGSPLDAVIGLLDEGGVEIGYSDDYYIFKDPHLVHTFEKSGTYYVRIYGSGESGSDSSDYRLTAGEMPQVDYAMPMGGQRGEPVEIRLAGVNLSAIEAVVLGDGLATGEIVSRSARSATIRLTVPKDVPEGVHRLHVGGASLPVPFVVSSLREISVSGDVARLKEDAYPVTLPVVANGVLDRPRAMHYFTFRVEEPQSVVFMADSMKLDFPLDPLVVVYDETGKRIAYQDEPTTNTGRNPANMDVNLTVHLSKAGRYIAMVRDAAFRGWPNFPYRLTMRRAEPRFEVNVIGTDETLFRGTENKVAVWIRRIEGWDQPVEVSAENLPEGVTAEKVVVEPVDTTFRNTCGEEHRMDGTKVEIPFHVASDAPIDFSQIRIVGRGVMQGRAVEREGYTQYWWRINQKIMDAAETGRMYATIADLPPLVLSPPETVRVTRGKAETVRVLIERFDNGGAPLEIAADAPEGVVVERATIDAGAAFVDLKVTASTDEPATIVLAGKSAGKLLGRSHPIVIQPSEKSEPREVSDDN